jgi:hypothetical protein
MVMETTPQAGWSFESLGQADRTTLETVLRTGAAPDLEQLEGYSYCGWNHEWISKLSGQKFKKGFRARDGQRFGYNELVHQDGKGPAGAWEVKMRDGRPRQVGYFAVSLLQNQGRAHFDYNVSINTWLNLPFRVIRDYVVLPNPGDHDLLLGKAYLKLGPSIFYSYFLLGHREKIAFEPWG